MRLRQQLLTKNDCYRAGKTIRPRGVMVHSTGANNPRVARYIPGDDEIGRNTGGSHWDQPGKLCVHAFIGRFADGGVGAVQTLPWNRRAWHCGSGRKGSGNDTHISFEICEDGLSDPEYFRAVYREAVELTVYLCQQYVLDPLADGVVICHQEGYRRGLASNHGDVLHWFPRHGKTMDDFRADVARTMKGEDGEMSYEQWKEYMDRYRKELGTLPSSSWAEKGMADAIAAHVTDGTRPRDLATREECVIMARAAVAAAKR
ncbi:MAG: N-acetylmuramoyl-L-alanine amidase [Lawsonibacter sp.]|jgi:N-acetylmuramoyl-L-alanine amidase|nr:N-acetylmuramoyl-L-alanine amidase [Lawsonibacter sp.]